MSNHHTVHFKYITVSFVYYTSVRLRRKEKISSSAIPPADPDRYVSKSPGVWQAGKSWPGHTPHNSKEETSL